MPNEFIGLTAATNFTGPTSGTVNEPVPFTNLTNGEHSWFWDFGDGSISTVENPTHAYLEVGSYSVKLIASQNDIITGTVIRENFITIV
jgi:PKD repeat protein